ncbi:MAG: small multi-drug export protein [Clostridia bacterium]|nr:small multi-drug export protein [Clostridia bacterium]
MVEFIQNLINNDLISVIVVSLIPMIELKGGIVFARGVGFDFFQALGLAYLGSTIVFIPIFFLLIPLLNLFKKIKFVNKIATKAESYVQSKAREALEKQNQKQGKRAMSERFIKQLAVFIFVAIPLPMTGVWMGTAIAVFVNLKFKDAVLPIILGNLLAGIIISALASLCLALWTIAVLDYILYTLFGLAVILLVVMIIKIVKQKPDSDVQKGND